MGRPDDAGDSAAKAPAFVLRAPQPFWWTVLVHAPVDDTYVAAKLRVKYLPVEQPELDRMQGIGLDAAKGEQPPGDDEVIRRVVLDWSGPVDEAGAPVPFTAETLAQFCRVPMARTALVATYILAMKGMAARKNA